MPSRDPGGAPGRRAAGFAERELPYLLLALVVGRFLWESWELRPQIDDAYISYRYARNLVDGHGLVFNVGEYVEGFTNLLWTLLIACGIALGYEAPSVAHALGLLSGSALLVLGFAYARTFLPGGRAWAAAVVPALLLSTTTFGLWSTSGLETPLFAAMVTATLLAGARGRPGAATACAVLATLTRPDGVLVAAAVLGIPLLASIRGGWRAWRWPLLYGAAVLALTAFRLFYYGSPLPNTFYAKVGDIPVWRGLLQTYGFLRTGNGYLLIPLVFGLFGDRRVLPGAALIALFVAYIVYIGGDVFLHHRFFLAILPCMAALAVRGASWAYDRNRYLGVGLALLVGQGLVVHEFGRFALGLRAWVLGIALAWVLALATGRRRVLIAGVAVCTAGLLVAASTVGGVLGIPESKRARAIEKRHRAFLASERRGMRRAEQLAGESPAPGLVACMGIGSFGYFSGLPILDLFGLVDPTIARSTGDAAEHERVLPGHSRSNADYVLARAPDLIFMSEPRKKAKPGRLVMPASRALKEHPDFRANYRFDEQMKGYRRDARGLAEAEPASRSGRSAKPTGPGRWRKARTNRFDPALDDEQRRMIEELEAIGYVAGSMEAAGSGVTVHDSERVAAGLNFYTSGHGPEALLIDMEGRVLHRWRKDFREVWPDYPVPEGWPGSEWWRRAYLYPNGDVLAIFDGLGIIKLDNESKLLWANASKAHHDLEVRPNGEIWVLTREAHMVPRIHEERPILEDYIVVLGPDGTERRRISLLEALERSEYRHLWEESGVDPDEVFAGDIFHTNSLSVLDGRIAAQHPAFAKGNVLVSFLTFDVIAVVDPEQEKVLWAMKGDFRSQHDPQITADGELILFDNMGRKGRSSVQILDPVSGEASWIYRGSEEAPFYSQTCGTVQRTEGGNTLVTESDGGRAFELSPKGEIVWEFYNPHTAGDDGQYIATLFELRRLPLDYLDTPE